MGRSQKRKHDQRRAHQREQRDRKAEALAESTAAAKRSKKGKAGIEAQMRKRGYVLEGDGWKRLPQQSAPPDNGVAKKPRSEDSDPVSISKRAA